MPVEIGARGFVGSSAYGFLRKLSIGGNKRTKALRLQAETAENNSRWIWSRRTESMSSQQQRTVIADKTLENQSQVQNHSAKEIQAENRDDVLRHPSSDKHHRINFPPASS
ncbi:polyprotein [Plakobranchus ocellatus]|uniref:Polyprotein n=1 Tax=Plakobranchus ocellatus TaxID=259542 RepID=A0AAV4C6Q0_9GAST|nr:polyprotein [Plakobranchus ocellatus]